MRIATENIEMINHFNIVLNPNEHSLAYAKRVNELKRRGLKPEEIEKIMSEPIQMEMYYDPETDSVFALESEAVINFNPDELFNPYQGDSMLDALSSNDRMSTESMIDEINAVTIKFGAVEFGELQLDSHPIISETSSVITLIEGVGFNSITSVSYDKLTNEEISREDLQLDKLIKRLLTEVHYIALEWLSYNLENPKTIRTFKVMGVEYETDGEDVDLPTDYEFNLIDVEDDEIFDTLSDKISNESGFLVVSFGFIEIK